MLPKMEPAMLSLVALDARFPVEAVASARADVAEAAEGGSVAAAVAAASSGAEDAHDGSSSPFMVIGILVEYYSIILRACWKWKWKLLCCCCRCCSVVAAVVGSSEGLRGTGAGGRAKN